MESFTGTTRLVFMSGRRLLRDDSFTLRLTWTPPL